MKKNSYYICTECSYKSVRWLGKCPQCNSWGSFTEEYEKTTTTSKIPKDPVLISNIKDINVSKEIRVKTKFLEFDNLLGGGLVQGEVVLITGSPGIGKSTILLQLSNEYAKKNKVFYISGEESLKQVKDRAKRLKVNSDNLFLLSLTSIEGILESIRQNRPEVVIIDSIQTMYSDEVNSIPGSINQIKEVCMKIVDLAKKEDISFYIVGHVTKDGKLAGPKLLEHMVDACLQIDGDEQTLFRIIRSSKNRFGSTHEIAIFDMQENGMQEIKNPSEFFLSERDEKNIGSIIVTSVEGTKTILYEVQSLVVKNSMQFPKRVMQGYDKQRIEILIAVLSKYLKVDLSTHDIYINVPGGVEIEDRSTDLGIILSLISSVKNILVSQKIAAIGEIGLRGEVRKIAFIKKRVKELEKLGFTGVYVPYQQKEDLEKEKLKIKINYIKNIQDLLERMK